MNRPALRLLALVLPGLAVGAAGCTGSINGGAPADPGKPSTPGAPPPSGRPEMPGQPGASTPPATPDPTAPPPSAQVACPTGATDTVGRRSLRRLTIPELETTIRTVFGLDAKQWTGLNVPPDTGSDDGFTNNVDQLTVSPEYARGLQDSSRQIAGLVSADPLLGKLLPCAATGGQPCAETFVDQIGARLYRRPLTAAEKARYVSLFQQTGAEDFKSFVYWATSTMLQSPNVLYRSELGEPDGKGRFKLTPYEVASQLSYTFTGGPPTPELLQLAAASKLGTAAEVEAAARALIYDGTTVRPAFRAVLLQFVDQWLGLPRLANVRKDAMLYPEFSPKIQDALAEETRRFLGAVVLEDKGTIATLFTAPYTFVDATLSKYYGFGAVTGTDFQRVNRPAGWGVGLLAQGSMMAVAANGISTSPTRRGHVVRTSLMCNTVPPPPPVVDPIPEPSESVSTRQRYDQHSTNQACRGCHSLMDPIGYAFEHLDAAGRYRAKEGKFEIDDSALVTGTSRGDLAVKGPTELAQAIATLPEVNDCLASYMGAFALGLGHESAQCLVRSATDQLRAGGSVVDFYLHLAASDHFRYRQQ